MMFPSGLKRICDISFYMTFASILGGMLGSDHLLLTLPIFVFVAFLSAFLAPYGRIRYVSVIPLLMMFGFIPLTFVNVVVLGPAILFMIWTLPKPNEQVTEFYYAPVFYVFLFIFGLILTFTMVMMHGVATSGLLVETWLFAVSFLLNAVMFMRMTRHDESVLKQTGFKLMNATTLIGSVGIIIGVILLGTDAFLSFVRYVIGLVWSYLLTPILYFIVWLFFFTVSFIFRIIGLDGDFDLPEGLNMGNTMGGFEVMAPENEGVSIAPNFIIAIGIIIVVVLLFLLFKLLTSKVNTSIIRDDGVEEERFALDRGRKKMKRRFRQDNRNQVREVYRKFLVHVKKKGIEIPLHLTSYDVEGLVASKFESERSSKLRDVYVRVRYGEVEYGADDVKRVKGLYREVKEEIERF